MSGTQQLPLDLGHRTAYAREDLWVSPANAAAVAWIDKWPQWGAPALVLYGPPASGKTHLAHVWRQRSKAAYLDGTRAPALPETWPQPGAGEALILDNVENFIGDKARETALFHLYNRARDHGGALLLTAERAPRDWAFALPDLRSRLLAAPAAAVSSPDEQLMAIVLAKLFSDRQVFVPQEVVHFAVTRLERSFAALRDFVAEVDRKALAEKRPVTVPLVRDLLQSQGKLL
jgi:DnaA regulatory inactivator Hda